MLKPSRLRKGDVIGIIAPCLAAEEEYIAQAEKALGQMGFSVKLGKNLYSRANGFSGSPEERAADFNEMVLNPKVRMIFFDGGEVSNEILPYIDYEAAARNPKIILSYSDGTSVLNAVSALSGLETFYGQSPGTISRGSPYNLHRFTEMLVEGNPVYRKNSNWKVIRDGRAQGELIGGYLLNFALLMEGKFFRVHPEKRYILFLEDHICFNPPAAASRYFSHIGQSGLMSKVDGLIFGHYDGKPQPEMEEVLRRFGERYGIPVVWCDDFGHGENQAILPIGVEARFDAGEGTLTFLESLVL